MKKIVYVFKPYDKNFPELFEKEKQRIRADFKNQEIRMEHIGSTAVPGLGGKGIIDIIIAVPEEKLAAASKKLAGLGYEFSQSGSKEERRFFMVQRPEARYHSHLTFFGSREWPKALAFRSHLLANKDARDEYVKIKKRAARQAKQDGLKYKKIKEPFILKILEKNFNKDA